MISKPPVINNDNIGKVCFSAGGTGGHVYAAIPVIEALLKENIKIQVITDTRGLKYYDTIKDKISIDVLVMDGLGKISIYKRLYGIFFMISAIISTFIKFLFHRPDMVIGFGGHPAFPAVLSAAILRIPIIIHEQNSVLGKANRIMARFAKAICLSYKDTQKIPAYALDRVIYTGMPLRKEILTTIKSKYDPIHKDQFTIFIMGGSQGSNIFSETVPSAIKLLPKDCLENLTIIQQCRANDMENVSKIYNRLKIKNTLSDFFDNVPEILTKSSLVISRSGSSSVNEITNSKIPAIYIPYPYASDNHQYYNALAACTANGAWLIEQKNLTPESLKELLSKLINKPMLLREFSANLKKLAVTTATEKIIDTIISVHLNDRPVEAIDKQITKKREKL